MIRTFTINSILLRIISWLLIYLHWLSTYFFPTLIFFTHTLSPVYCAAALADMWSAAKCAPQGGTNLP